MSESVCFGVDDRSKSYNQSVVVERTRGEVQILAIAGAVSKVAVRRERREGQESDNGASKIC
jgi:hypothetical protein